MLAGKLKENFGPKIIFQKKILWSNKYFGFKKICFEKIVVMIKKNFSKKNLSQTKIFFSKKKY